MFRVVVWSPCIRRVVIFNALIQIAGKQAGYRAMTEFYQSLVCKNNKAVGEEIARLEVCSI